jgi:hypothetical protein
MFHALTMFLSVTDMEALFLSILAFLQDCGSSMFHFST